MSEQTLSRNFVASLDSVRQTAPMKRAFDVAVSLVALILLAPFLAVIAITIKRDSPGPVIYRGPRVGRNGKTFKILKFRTMHETAESYSGAPLTAHDDPRVTTLGRWLRKTKLNELPQFWNVLVGEMSLVGPRPEDPTVVEHWPQDARDEILSVRPGITSPASVLYRNEEAMLCVENVFRRYLQEIGPDKMRLDQLYVRHRSFWLDLDTLMWTSLIMVPKIRAYDPPERLLFVGPISHLFRRYVNWFVADLTVTLVAVGSTGLVWRAFGPLNVGLPKAAAAALALALLFSLTGAILGINRIAWSKAAPVDIYDVWASWAIAATVASVANWWLSVLPAGVVVVASVLSLFGFIAVRYRTRMATGLVSQIVRLRAEARNNRERVLIVGSEHTAQYAAWIMERPDNVEQFKVFGFVDDDMFAQGMRVCGANIVGTWRDIPKLIAKHKIKVIILADSNITQDQHNALITICRTTKTRLVSMPDMVDSLSDLCRHTPASQPIKAGARAVGGAMNCLDCLSQRSTEKRGLQRQESTAEVV